MPLAEKLEIKVDDKVTPEECVHVREDELTPHAIELWRQCLDQSLCVVSARIDGDLVGIGFIVGNRRHATIVDLVVHPAVRKRGIGGKIVDELLLYTKEQNTSYIGLTFDQSKPWLKEFYQRHGFDCIDFGMWHKRSLALLR